MRLIYLFLSAIAGTLLLSCNTKPEPFKYGKDICHICKMGIIDPKFGCEVITNKGKVYKFDDVICTARFLKSGAVKDADIKKTVVINFEKENDFLDITTSYFIAAPEIKSPMGSNAAAFRDKAAAEKFILSQKGQTYTWDELFKKTE